MHVPEEAAIKQAMATLSVRDLHVLREALGAVLERPTEAPSAEHLLAAERMLRAVTQLLREHA